MYNRIQLIGYIGKDPEIRLLQENKFIVTFSLASHKSWRDSQGLWQKETLWHQITVYKESVVKWAQDHLRQGAFVFVEGELAYHHWTDKFDNKREKAHIVIRGPQGHIYPLRSGKLDQENEIETLPIPANQNGMGDHLSSSIDEANTEVPLSHKKS